MIILKDWEWKYHIFFNNNVLDKVNQFKEQLNKEEQRLFQKQIKFYLSFYTIENLLQALNDPSLNKDDVIKKALKNIKKCNRTLPALKNSLRKKINKIEDEKIRDKVIDILEYSTTTIKQVDFSQYIKMVCGKQLYNKIYNMIIKDNKKCNYHPIKIKPILYTELKNDIQALYDNEDIKVNFGATNNLQFKIKLVSDKKYFGAFWDKELYDEYEEDTLVICTNQIKTIDEYWYTLIHEVYPGHGYFFEMVKQNNTAFDTGANMLIEGYATYCEISSIESNYAVYLRQHYKMIISKLLNNKISTLSNAQKYLFNQQIGYLESYYFGAFLIEYLIDEHFKSPLKLLQFLSKNTKGEMFKLWLKDI